MARFERLTVLSKMVETGLVPIFYHKDPGVTLRALEGCVAGGSVLFEFTNRGDRAARVFKELITSCEEKNPEVILGVGSVEDPATAALYLSLGASFVVSPIWNPELARLCNRRKVAHIPGCGTVTEIGQAEELGCEIVKVFPAGALGGPGFIKAVRGPRPWTRILPTGGVEPTEENVRSWIQAGAACLGMGSRLFDVKKLEKGGDAGLPDRVANVLAWIQDARNGRKR